VDQNSIRDSEEREPDVGVYPDSNKIGVFRSKKDRASYVFFRSGEAVDYWDGEG